MAGLYLGAAIALALAILIVTAWDKRMRHPLTRHDGWVAALVFGTVADLLLFGAALGALTA